MNTLETSNITSPSRSASYSNEVAASAQDITILLVDDDTALRSLTGSYLSKKGYHVVSCCDAELAGEVVKSSTKIDLLITDVDMPLRSGTELGLEMNQFRPAVPVLLISGGFRQPHVEQASERGWNRLAKPFRLPELLKTVHVLLDLAHHS